MRYTQGKQWVEIVGASQLSMRELNALYSGDVARGFAILAEVVKEADVRDRYGEPINLSRPDEYDRLTLKQYDWLRSCVVEAARDETLDPEA